MGGSIRVESTLGEGTRFILTLKAKCQPLEMIPAEEIKSELGRVSIFKKNAFANLQDGNNSVVQIDTTRFRILLVNDEPFQLYAF